MKHDLRSKSVSTKVSEAELRVLESRAERSGLTLSEWVRDVLLGSSVDAGTMAAERAILAEMLAMRAILLNFMLKLSMRQPITELVSYFRFLLIATLSAGSARNRTLRTVEPYHWPPERGLVPSAFNRSAIVSIAVPAWRRARMRSMTACSPRRWP